MPMCVNGVVTASALGQRRRSALNAALEKPQIKRPRRVFHRLEQALGLDVGKRGIVLMDAMDCHLAGHGMGRPGEGAAPALVGFVAQTAPVDSAQHDRLPHAQQNDAEGVKGIFDVAHRLDPAATQGMPHRRRDVGGKSR